MDPCNLNLCYSRVICTLQLIFIDINNNIDIDINSEIALIRSFFLNAYLFTFARKRGGENKHEQERDRERGRERIPNRLFTGLLTVRSETNMEVNLTNCEIMT